MLITKTTKKATFAFLLLSGATLSARAAETAVPAALAAPGESVVLSVHAEGAQVYDCKAGADGKPMLSFREPDRDAAGRRQDHRASLCRAELGTQRRQRRGRQGLGQRPRRDRK